MKYLYSFFILFLLVACNYEPKQEDNSAEIVAEDLTPSQNFNWSGCYSFETSGDQTTSYYLRIDCKDSVIYGSMMQNIDAPNITQQIIGDISGFIKDSILYVEYNYNVEGDKGVELNEFKMKNNGSLVRKTGKRALIDGKNTLVIGEFTDEFTPTSCNDFPKIEDTTQIAN
jgi:hypothetical protein